MPDAKNVKKVHYFHAEANSLGGFIDKPTQKVVPSQASASLPSVGGHAANRTEAFNFEGVVSCTSAYSRVSGRHLENDGSSCTSVTSVVEGLNLLEVVTADKVVAQISMEHPADGGPPVVSFTGSRFEGLKIGGRDVSLTLSSSLLDGGVAREQITWPLFQKTGGQQAAKLVKSAKSSGDTYQWVVDRYGWIASDRGPKTSESILCSLLDGVDAPVPCKVFRPRHGYSEFWKTHLWRSISLPRIRPPFHDSGGIRFPDVRGNEHCQRRGQRRYHPPY